MSNDQTLYDKTLFFIPARGGSKGVPNKNIKLLNGKPLICYSIDIAKNLAKDTDICVSTDNREIIALVEEHGLKIPFTRPATLATDESPTEDSINHAIDYYNSIGVNYEKIVILQPTSPFRMKSHVEDALRKYTTNLDMVFSVCETDANPYFVLFEEDDKGTITRSKNGNFIRRQDCPKVWQVNGAVYVINVSSLKQKRIKDFTKIALSVMPAINSVDIDTDLDWKWAEFLCNSGAITI